MTTVPFPYKKREWVGGGGPTPHVEVSYDCVDCGAPYPQHQDTCHYAEVPDVR